MLFYLRESSRSDLASYHALSTCCPLMRVRVLRPELNLKIICFCGLMNAYDDYQLVSTVVGDDMMQEFLY